MTDRTAWQCPNCSRWNAPHVDVCDCVPAPVEKPLSTEEMFAVVLEELHKLEAQGFNWHYVPLPYIAPQPIIYVQPMVQPYRITPSPTWIGGPTIISTTGTAAASSKAIAYGTNGVLASNVQ